MMWTLRYRLGAWLETVRWTRTLVLREDSSTAQFIEPYASRVMRVELVNRINGRRGVIYRMRRH